MSATQLFVGKRWVSDSTILVMSTLTHISTSSIGVPRLVSMRCHRARGASYSWHSHSFYELTLVTEDNTKIGYPPGERPTQPNTLLFYRPGEQHGAWNSPQQAPSYWVLHFAADSSLCPTMGLLANEDPRQRVWQLTPDQS